jgi:hypothetical protein
MFAISAVLFGVTAATAAQPILRWIAVAAIAMSVSTAIHDAMKKEQSRLHSIEVQRYHEELQKPPAN